MSTSSTSESKLIPGRECGPALSTLRDDLLEKYRAVANIGGQVKVSVPREERDRKSNKLYYAVDVRLVLKKDWQTLLEGTGKDGKDTKGAYEDLISKLGGEVPSTVKNEKDLRQMAHNDISKKYGSAAVVNDVVEDGKAMVKVTVKKGGVVARGIGKTEEEAYNNIPRA